MTVPDLMRESVVTAGPDTATDELARRMRDENVGSVVVAEGEPVGIVTDRDLAVGPFAAGDDPGTGVAEGAMTPDPATVPVDAGVMDLCDALCDASVRRMPVVDDEGTLAGIVTLDDLHVLLADEGGRLAEVVEAESPPY